MENINDVTGIAQGISSFGLMVIIASFYLVLTAMMMIAIFRWFKNIINHILEQSKQDMKDVLDETRKQNDLLQDLADGLRSETQLRLRNISGFAFDLSVEQVCRIIKKVKNENNIANREATKRKIRLLVKNIHEDRNSRFDPFSYRGKPLSSYCSNEWIDRVSQVVEEEIYNENGQDNNRAYTNVKAVYDDIKIDFYHRLNAK